MRDRCDVPIGITPRTGYDDREPLLSRLHFPATRRRRSSACTTNLILAATAASPSLTGRFQYGELPKIRGVGRCHSRLIGGHLRRFHYLPAESNLGNWRRISIPIQLHLNVFDYWWNTCVLLGWRAILRHVDARQVGSRP